MSVFDAGRLWGSLQAPRESLPASYRAWLVAVLAVCFALRLALAWFLPNIHQADEVYQVAEQAHRAAHGYGIVPWEFRASARAVEMPVLVAPIYHLDVSAGTRRLLQAAVFCALSLIPVWVAFQWAGRLYGLWGAVLASLMMATWFELLLFASKPLADVVCSYFLLAAVFLARPAASMRAVCLAGASLALAVALRVQIGPAAAVVALLAVLVPPRRRVAALGLGLAAGLAGVGIVEWAWWGVPFQGQVGYLRVNLAYGASSFFSHEPAHFFVKQYILMLGLALPIVAWLVYAGARRAPVLFGVAIAVLVPFHFFDHKEYRFAIAAVPMWVLLMGIAAAGIAERLALTSRPKVIAVLMGGWLVGMTAVNFGDYYRPLWTLQGNHVLAFEEIGRQPDACGVALVNIRWWHTPGYSGLGRDVPIYEIRSDEDAERLREAANYVLLGTKAPEPPAPYERWREYTRPVQYLYRRPGGCTPSEADRVMYPPSGINGLNRSSVDLVNLQSPDQQIFNVISFPAL